MTLDEVIQIVKTGEPMGLADMRLAYKVVFGYRPPIGWLPNELMEPIEDRVRRDHPEQFDELNHADDGGLADLAERFLAQPGLAETLEVGVTHIESVVASFVEFIKKSKGAA